MTDATTLTVRLSKELEPDASYFAVALAKVHQGGHNDGSGSE